MSAIYVSGVSKTYKRYEKQERIIDNFFRRKYKEKVAVDDISFEIGKGERVAIIGQNGAGKTTLMKMLSGLLLPTAGEIKVLNYIPFKKEKEYKKSMTLLMGQKQQLWWDVSANDNFLLLKDIYELTSSEYNKNINELVEMLNLHEIQNNPIRTLSLGERMKCELAGSLLYKPKVLFLDEPTIGLDLVAQNDVRKFIKNYSKDNDATVILTSHNMGDIEAVCDRTIFIDHGKMYYDGALSNFVSEHGKDSLMSIELLEPTIDIKWEKYGEIIYHDYNHAKIRIPKSEISSIRHEIQDISGIGNIYFSELDAEEIVRDFYEKEK